MSSLMLGGTISISTSSAPPNGWIIGYDVDGVLKQKDKNGVITLVGGSSSVSGIQGPTGATGNPGIQGPTGATGATGSSATVTLNNNTNNYVATMTGTMSTLNGESNLTFNGSTLAVSGSLTTTSNLTINGTSSLKNTTIIGDGGNGSLIIPLNDQVITTTDSSATLISLPTQAGLIYTVSAKVIGYGNSDRTIGGDSIGVFKNISGTVTRVSSAITNIIEDFVLTSPSFTLTATGSNIILQVTGVTYSSISWSGQIQYISQNNNL